MFKERIFWHLMATASGAYMPQRGMREGFGSASAGGLPARQLLSQSRRLFYCPHLSCGFSIPTAFLLAHLAKTAMSAPPLDFRVRSNDNPRSSHDTARTDSRPFLRTGVSSVTTWN